MEVLESLNLDDKKDMKAGNLTIADRKRLEIARALATEPKLLLLDEVMAGLRPTEVDEMVKIIKRSARQRHDDLHHRTHHARDHGPCLTGLWSSTSGGRFPKGPRKKLPRMKK